MNKFSRFLIFRPKALARTPSICFQRWRPLGLEPARRCTPSWCPAFNVSPLAVESSDFHVNVSPCAVESSEYHAISWSQNLWKTRRLDSERLSENMNKMQNPFHCSEMFTFFSQFFEMVWLRLEHVKTSRLPLYIGDQQTLYEKFADTFIFRWLSKLKVWNMRLLLFRSSSCLRVIEGKDAQDLCQECKVQHSSL